MSWRFALGALLIAAPLAVLAHGDDAAPRTARGALAAPDAAERRAGPQDWVARIDGRPVPTRVALALLRMARREQPDMSLQALVEHLGADLALAQRALTEAGDAELFPAGRVAYTPEAQRRQETRATLRLLFGADYQASAAALPRWLPTADPAPRLRQLWPERPGLQLDDGFDDVQQAQAEGLVLLRYAGCGGLPAQSLTLAGLWPSLDVQARALLRRGDADFTRQSAHASADDACFDRWMTRRWSSDELNFLDDVVAARQRRVAWMAWLGLGGDTHRGSHAFDVTAAAVSEADIAAFHARQPRRFERVDALKGWQIQCPDEACAQAIATALKEGRSPAALQDEWRARLGAARAGPLDWRRDAASLPTDDWLLSLALAQPPRQLSPPVRRPAPEGVSAAWQLVWVEERVMGRHPADSESVRYLARQELARERLQQRWQDELRGARAGLRLEWAPGVAS